MVPCLARRRLKMSRTLEIDVLRILAACWIFYFHAGLCTNWMLSEWGEYAVATFIYLTTFCAFRFSRMDRWSSYLAGRLRALYPTFTLISLILFAASFAYSPLKKGTHYTLPELLANLLLISPYIGLPWFSHPMWFMSFLVQIYCVLPLMKRIPFSWRVVPISFLVSAGACAMVYGLSPVHAEQICREWSPLFRVPEVVIGCCMASAVGAAEVVHYAVAYLFCCGLLGMAGSFSPNVRYTALLPLRGAIVFGTTLAASRFALPLLRARAGAFLSLLARASFPFFLVQGPAMSLICKRWGANPIAWAGYFLLCWAGSVCLIMGMDRVMGWRLKRTAPVL